MMNGTVFLQKWFKKGQHSGSTIMGVQGTMKHGFTQIEEFV